jgi:hypothetical protein
MRRLRVTANVVPISPILVTLMIEALITSETSVLTRATERNIPEDGILQHSYGSPWPVMRTVLLFYVDDVRTSQETLLRASTACCGDNFTVFTYLRFSYYLVLMMSI